VSRRRRSGFVAAVALYALAMMAGLALASFYAVMEARRAADRGARQAEAASAADAGVAGALSSWDVARRESLPVGAIDSGAPGGALADGGRTFVIRLTQSVYWIASAGRAATGSRVESARTHTLLVEVLRPEFPTGAALVSRGNIIAAGEVTIDGDDSPPPDWEDCSPVDTAAAPAIVVPPGNSATFEDGRPLPNIRLDTAAATPAAFQSFGRVEAAALAARATLTIAPGAILSPAPDTTRDCQIGHGATPSNWGDPARGASATGCERFHPVIRALGDLTVAGGRGQGVLLVSGRLRIQGPFVFAGVVIAGGGIEATGPGVRIYGVAMSAGAAGVSWLADGEVRRSTCAVSRVVEAAARVYPVPRRAWAELL
jgi:hypothetical protein